MKKMIRFSCLLLVLLMAAVFSCEATETESDANGDQNAISQRTQDSAEEKMDELFGELFQPDAFFPYHPSASFPPARTAAPEVTAAPTIKPTKAPENLVLVTLEATAQPTPTPSPSAAVSSQPTPIPSPSAAVSSQVTPIPSPVPSQAAEIQDKAEEYTAVIDDKNDILTKEEEKTLLGIMQPLTEFGSASLLITDSSRTAGEGLADLSVSHLHPGSSSSCVLFVIDTDSRTTDIFLCGAMEECFSRSLICEISSDISKYASNGDYYRCAEAGYAQLASAIDGSYPFSPLRVACLAVFSLTLGLLINHRHRRNANIQLRPSPLNATRCKNIVLKIEKLVHHSSNLLSVPEDNQDSGSTSGRSSGSFAGRDDGSSF